MSRLLKPAANSPSIWHGGCRLHLFCLGVLCLIYQGAHYAELYEKRMGATNNTFALLSSASPGVGARLDDNIQAHSWDSLGVVTNVGEGGEVIMRKAVDLRPFETLHKQLERGHATLFVLRIQKAASSILDQLFSTDSKIAECQPNMRELEWLDSSETCNRLFELLHRAEYDPDICLGSAGWEDPIWEHLDCITWIFSYAYKDSYQRLPEPIRARLKQTFRRSRLVSGHFSYGIHSIGHRGAFAYITTLREPMARVISWWNWNIQLGRHAELVPNSTFDEFVMNPNFLMGGFQKSNHMTRVLCNQNMGIMDGESEELLSEDTPLARLTEVTRRHYECAVGNLLNFVLVFVAENATDVLQKAPVISRMFQMKVLLDPIEDEKSNPTTFDPAAGMVRRSLLSNATAAKLRALNTWDNLLYEHARMLHSMSMARLEEMEKRWV